MIKILLVGAGGFLGAVLRYLTGAAIHYMLPNAAYPFGTLTVNIIGCLVIGLLVGLNETLPFLTPELSFFMLIGVLGGFTTFSSFGYETFHFAQKGHFNMVFSHISLNVVLGLGSVWLGAFLSRFIVVKA